MENISKELLEYWVHLMETVSRRPIGNLRCPRLRTVQGQPPKASYHGEHLKGAPQGEHLRKNISWSTSLGCDAPKPKGPVENPSTHEIPMGIAYLNTTISCPINRDPFMHIYCRRIYKFIKTVHKSSRSIFFSTKRFLKATVMLSSHLRSRMRVSHLYITCT